MSIWIPAASIVGALGLFIAGQHWITTGLRASRPRTWEWISNRLRRMSWRGAPFLIGLTTALAAPTGAWSSRATLGTVQRVGRPLERTLWQVIGSCMALCFSAWLALGVQSASETLEPLAWSLLGIGGLVYSVLPRTRSYYWVALGLGACLLGLLELERGFSGIEGVRIDAWGVAMPLRLTLAILLGAAGAALLRSPGAVLVTTLYAADHGSLNITTGIALFIGAGLGSLGVTLPAWRRDGNAQARRAGLCMVVFQVLVAGLTILSLALGLPLLGDPPPPFDQPIWLLTVWTTLALVGSTLVAIPLAQPGIRILESRLGLLDSSAAHSPIQDPNTLVLPTVTLECLRQELNAMRRTAATLARRVLGEEQVSDFRATRDIQTVNERALNVTHASREILAGEAPAELRRVCEWAPGAGTAYLETCRQMDNLRRPDLQPALIPNSALRARVLQLRWSFLHFVERGCAPETTPLQRAQERYQFEVQATDVKGRLLHACSERSMEPLMAHAALAGIDTLQSVAQTLATALEAAEALAPAVAPDEPAQEPAPAPEPEPVAEIEPPVEPAIGLEEPAAPLPSARPTPTALFAPGEHP